MSWCRMTCQQLTLGAKAIYPTQLLWGQMPAWNVGEPLKGLRVFATFGTAYRVIIGGDGQLML